MILFNYRNEKILLHKIWPKSGCMNDFFFGRIWPKIERGCLAEFGREPPQRLAADRFSHLATLVQAIFLDLLTQ